MNNPTEVIYSSDRIPAGVSYREQQTLLPYAFLASHDCRFTFTFNLLVSVILEQTHTRRRLLLINDTLPPAPQCGPQGGANLFSLCGGWHWSSRIIKSSYLPPTTASAKKSFLKIKPFKNGSLFDLGNWNPVNPGRPQSLKTFHGWI